MRREKEIRAKLKEVQTNILKYLKKTHDSSDPNAQVFRMDVDFYNGGEWYLAWVLNDKEEK